MTEPTEPREYIQWWKAHGGRIYHALRTIDPDLLQLPRSDANIDALCGYWPHSFGGWSWQQTQPLVL